MRPAELNQIQRWMQAVITHPGGVAEGAVSAAADAMISNATEQVEQIIRPSRKQTAAERLQVYSNAYFARLLDCLREEYPALRHAAGEDAFEGFAIGYLQQHPSQSYTLADLGAGFPGYLAETRPASAVSPADVPVGAGSQAPQDTAETETGASGLRADWPEFLIELARLERLYGDVFDGPGVEGQPLLDAAQLKLVPPERWPDAKLVPVSCLRLVALEYPVHEYISAVRRGESPEFPLPAETFLAVTRRDYIIRRQSLSRVQFALLEAITEGRTVSEAISEALAIIPTSSEAFAHSLHDWFSAWTAAGYFQTVVLPA